MSEEKRTQHLPAEVGTFQQLRNIQALRDGILGLQKILPTWTDEELAQLFAETADLEGAFYAARCYACHLLAERHGGSENRAGLRGAASVLGISYAYARELSSIWKSILSKLEDGLPALPQGFFSRAIRASKYGVDPVDAIRHALHVKEALGRPYSVQQFEHDIRQGLPQEDGSPVKSCTVCEHYATGKGRLVLYGEDGEALAEAETEGVRYCAQYGLLRSALGDLRVRGSDCQKFSRVSSTTGGEKDGS